MEPSIRGRQLYIPLMAWFCYSTKTALPLIALQYQEVHVKIEFRPVKELFTIKNVTQTSIDGGPEVDRDKFKRKAPNTAAISDQMWHFLQSPPKLPKNETESNSMYLNRRNDWNADIHLVSTYIFLGEEERRKMASDCHNYLIKSQFEWDFLNVTGSKRVDIPSRDMVSSYMWRFRRSDVNQRNQWNNYQNFAWENEQPNELEPNELEPNLIGLMSTGCMSIENVKDIMIDLAILCGQDYRENILAAGVYNFVEKWFRTTGIAKDGLYCYNFCTNSSRLVYQPTGAQNTNKWKWLTFEFNTIQPPLNDNPETNSVDVLCDPSGAIIGVRKDVWTLNKYNFDLRVFEERYNMIEITGGRIGLAYAR
jgi:hypothetical protein